mmetsp:Transcript_51940/g.111063  ORF Transcript_51940/g.111063 Transcript_51940/m.111063 type:complete len:209 (-) Transcript_51940:478-1104(-)
MVLGGVRLGAKARHGRPRRRRHPGSRGGRTRQRRAAPRRRQRKAAPGQLPAPSLEPRTPLGGRAAPAVGGMKAETRPLGQRLWGSPGAQATARKRRSSRHPPGGCSGSLQLGRVDRPRPMKSPRAEKADSSDLEAPTSGGSLSEVKRKGRRDSGPTLQSAHCHRRGPRSALLGLSPAPHRRAARAAAPMPWQRWPNASSGERRRRQAR